MIAARPTPAQVGAQVAEIRRKVRHAGVIGIRYVGPWEGPPQLQAANEVVDVARLDSGLAIRALLATRPGDAPPLVLLTSLGDAELGGDVLARLARRRLYQVSPWEIVRDLFRARDVDPSLADKTWMAEALVEQAPPEGYPPVPGSILDAETVWRILLGSALGLETPTPDVADLLRWTVVAEHVDRYRLAPAELREGTRDWIGRRAGEAGLAILACAEAGSGRDALPLGLACRVVFDPAGQEELALREAAVRLERYLGHRRLDPAAARLWGAVAEHVARGLDEREARPWLERGDAILEAVGAGSHAHLSPVSPAGLDQRLGRYAQALVAALERTRDRDRDTLVEAALAVREHAFATARPERGDRLDMALRLVRWLAARRAADAPPPRSFGEAAGEYLRDGGFVDWARTTLRGGEAHPALSDAYGRLALAVGEERERGNRDFGTLLADWCAAGASPSGVLPIEHLLAEIVAEVARAAPVLLLVLDGMSVAVWRELLDDLVVSLGWAPVAPPGHDRLPPVIAALPTVTEVSRASLLSGRVTAGASASEKGAFTQHPALLRVSKPKHPPTLFHKAELGGGATDLADGVREAIASPDRRLVGVVLNAVDDFLLKSDQVRPRWTVGYVQLLDALLYAARAAGRAIVLTSDHGHVLDAEGRVAKHDQGDRWRLDDGSREVDEIVLEGPRVVTPTGPRVVAPWSERTRYGVRKNGYHGGATPQEVVVPLGVLVPPGVRLDGWVEASMDYPDWWDVTSAAPPLSRPATRPRPVQAGQNLAFEFAEVPAGTAGPAATADVTVPAGGGWLDALLGSPVYASQRTLAGRVAPPDDRVRQLLAALDQRGGKLTRAALAHRLGLPPVRVNGLVAAVRRLLNVEGYPILAVDEASDTVELNRELLRLQFGL